MSIVFDRAASYYDETRALPPEVALQPIQALVRETGVDSSSRVLELGIGTGRIAIPLARQIGHLTGVDLSLSMMELLRSKLVGEPLAIDPVRADAVRLSFPEYCFDLVYAVHVLHLVDGWRDAVAESRRVLKPSGCLAVSWHRRVPDSPNALLRKELHRLVQDYGIDTRRPGAQTEEEIYEALASWGTEPKIVEAINWSEETTPAQILDELSRQLYSETWMIPRQVMDQVAPCLRAFAQETFGPLDRAIRSAYNFRWLIARKLDAR